MAETSAERRQARYPEEFAPYTLAEMEVGDVAYTVPWAMVIDSDRYCWLQSSFASHAQPGGTMQMRVERREDGFHVQCSRLTPREVETQQRSHADVPADAIPVAELTLKED